MGAPGGAGLPVELPNEGSTYQGISMAQTWADLYLYEQVLNEHPELVEIVELGTGEGGLSLFLHSQCESRSMVFCTHDVVKPSREIPGWSRIDVLREHELVARSFIHPMLLICDNGNKPLELATYAKYLETGDLVAVHDWETEIFPDDVPSILTPVHEDWCHSMTRIFVRHED